MDRAQTIINMIVRAYANFSIVEPKRLYADVAHEIEQAEREARAAAIEEAAQIAENARELADRAQMREGRKMAGDIEEAIRALADAAPPKRPT